MKETKSVIIIVGPTASGKTDLSLELASYFNTEIISADSRQCYRELNIGVAKPSAEALDSVKHHFINSHSVHDDVNAQIFGEYALNAVSGILQKNNIAVMVGGTGLYIRSFCEGFDEIPEVSASIRNAIMDSYKEEGLSWLQNELQKKDPAFLRHGEQKNPQRLMRALEVVTATGSSITSFRKNRKKQHDFKIIKVGVALPKDQLHANIDMRVDSMISNGLVEEASSLQAYRHLNALQTVGYTELFNFFEGTVTLQQAITAIKSNTRQYAKRQLTWFKKDSSVKWVDNSLNDKKSFLSAILRFSKQTD